MSKNHQSIAIVRQEVVKCLTEPHAGSAPGTVRSLGCSGAKTRTLIESKPLDFRKEARSGIVGGSEE
jgi:hypothetical protein